ncbi:MAG TPA: MMPL family transporter [Candidatus Baltobacteraceae bacterium]|jgi:predicted exporter/lauroyl/myristoyl acyltransferase|nr:MMPL family transporter [Candidatus Baltobacteraceae bacterium]
MSIARRWFVAVLLLAIVAGCFRLHFDVQVLDLLPPHLKPVEGLKLYEENFANNRELIVSLRVADAPTADAAAESLAAAFRAQSNLVESVRWRPIWLEDPALSAELLAYIWFNQAPPDFRALADRLAETNLVNVLQSTKENLTVSFSPADLARMAYDPYGMTALPESTMAQIPQSMRDQNWFASEDGTYHVLFVQARSDLANYAETIEWVDAMQRVAGQWQRDNPRFAGARLAFTGPPAFVAEAAAGMRHDLTASVLGTLVFIGLLFWIAYRDWRPLILIVALLSLIVAVALALGGLLMGTLNVVSLGFAGILLGITADYALVSYQSSLANRETDPGGARGKVAAGIMWSAVTTAGAFLFLRVSGFPGLAQLATLAALGLVFGAILILTFFPMAFKFAGSQRKTPRLPPFTRTRTFAVLGTASVIAFVIAGWAWRRPLIDYGGEALQPVNSRPYAALKEMEHELDRSEEPYIALVRGKTEQDVLRRLTALNAALTNAVAHREIASFMLPLLLWPRPEAQSANRQTAQQLWDNRAALREAALTNGFSTNALVLTDALLTTWHQAAQSPGVFWPTNEMSRWILQRVVARNTNGYLAMGPVYPNKGASAAAAAELTRQLPADDTWLAGWQPLAGQLLRMIGGRLAWMLGGVLVFLVIALRLALGLWIDVLLSACALGLSGLWLCAFMQIMGWSWNLLNVMALPLLLGAGVDYTILMQLALRRHRGDLDAAHREIGVALVLSCATAAAGFGSLSWASNAGLAGLGRVCAVGILATGFVAIFLLPFWRRGHEYSGAPPTAPPGIYCATSWKFGLTIARVIPQRLLYGAAEFLSVCYCWMRQNRRETVIANLLPTTGGRRPEAQRACRRLFRNFGHKLVDLWRCEAGLPVAPLITEFVGAEALFEAHRRKQGVLLVTPHLGNWEVGGYALAARGIKLYVVTLSEPAPGLTETRAHARALNGIETIVVGDDPFGFVQIIKRLQDGAVMAILLDRPREASRVTVDFFGRPFHAAVAAADLARASGCLILPVFLPRAGRGYRIELLPEIAYERNELGGREARQRLTQRIFRAFEPFVRQYPDQWYHFIPIWPSAKTYEETSTPAVADGARGSRRDQ